MRFVKRMGAHENGNTAFLTTVQKGRLEVVREPLTIPLACEAEEQERRALILADEERNDSFFWLNHLIFDWALKNKQSDIALECLQFSNVRHSAHWNENNALEEAAKNGLLEVVAKLLEIDAVREEAHMHNGRALRLAVKNNHGDVALALLGLPKVRLHAHEGENYAFLWVVQNGLLEVMRKLLKMDAVRREAHVHNGRALRLAAQYKHSEMALELLHLPNIRWHAHEHENNAVTWAVKNGLLEVVRALLCLPNVCRDAHINNNKMLAVAAQEGYTEIVRALLDLPNVRLQAGKTGLNHAFYLAGQYGHTEVVQALLPFLKRDQDTRLTLDVSFQRAAAEGYIEMLQTLLDFPAYPEEDTTREPNNSTLRFETDRRQLRSLRRLLLLSEMRHAVFSTWYAALVNAVTHHRLQVVEILLSFPAVQAQAHAGKNTLLRHAIKSKQEEMTALLLTVENVRRTLDDLKEDPLVQKVLYKQKCYLLGLYPVGRGKGSAEGTRPSLNRDMMFKVAMHFSSVCPYMSERKNISYLEGLWKTMCSGQSNREFSVRLEKDVGRAALKRRHSKIGGVTQKASRRTSS